MKFAKVDILTKLGRQVSDATILMHEAIARRVGLTGLDHKYLSIILRKGPLTAGGFSKLTGLTTGAVTGVIDRLEEKGLVRRQFDKSDRRKILIVPNVDKAKRLFDKSNGELRERMENLIGTYSEPEIELIGGYLSKAIEVMEGITTELNKNKGV